MFKIVGTEEHPIIVQAVKLDPWPFTRSAKIKGPAYSVSPSGRVEFWADESALLTVCDVQPWLIVFSDGRLGTGAVQWDGHTLHWPILNEDDA